jgi:hypothetical protein
MRIRTMLNTLGLMLVRGRAEWRRSPWRSVMNVVGLALLGTLVGCGGSSAPTTASDTTASESATSTPAVAPTPPPKPSVRLSVRPFRTVYADNVTLTGRVSPKNATVSIRGQNITVERGRWAFPVTLAKKGDTSYRFKATAKGHTRARATTVVTRDLSSAERAVIRQENAARRANRRSLQSAEDYLAMSGFSKQGLYEQLSSSAGEGFTPAEAQYAVDHVDVDWNKEAVQSARSYLQTSPMSRAELIDQLSSSAGEGFTYEQALYAVNKVY